VIEVRGVSVHRIAAGRLVEHWAQADMTSFMEQLGPAPARDGLGAPAAPGRPG
jgi:hypothetical protein